MSEMKKIEQPTYIGRFVRCCLKDAQDQLDAMDEITDWPRTKSAAAYRRGKRAAYEMMIERINSNAKFFEIKTHF